MIRRYSVERVHRGTDRARLPEAERAGVKSMPALVLDGAVFHVNFGAAIAALQ